MPAAAISPSCVVGVGGTTTAGAVEAAGAGVVTAWGAGATLAATTT